jgi:hypothetical protein
MSENIKIEPREILAKVGKFEIRGEGSIAEEYKVYADGKYIEGIQQVLLDIDARADKPVTLILKVYPDTFELRDMDKKKKKKEIAE